MKINCCYPNCDICKHNPCELKEPCNSTIINLEKEIAFELQELKSIKESLNHNLNDDGHYTLPYTTLVQLEFDTMEIIRELRKGLRDEIQSCRSEICGVGENP